jgi:hypothetical protein
MQHEGSRVRESCPYHPHPQDMREDIRRIASFVWVVNGPSPLAVTQKEVTKDGDDDNGASRLWVGGADG